MPQTSHLTHHLFSACAPMLMATCRSSEYTSCSTEKQKEEGMRGLILGAALSAVAAPALAAEFKLASTEVKSGSPMGIAQVFTACKGQNISPALSWSGEPTGTQSFAVTIYDSDARAGGGWWHWTVFNIPATVHSLATGAGSEGSKDLPAGAGEGRNDFGLSQYIAARARQSATTRTTTRSPCTQSKSLNCRWITPHRVPQSAPSFVPAPWPRLRSSDATNGRSSGVFRLVRCI